MLCFSGTEIVIPAHSLLPARDISRACLGSERRESLRGLAGEHSGEGPYGRTQPRSARAPAESSSFHGHQRDAWEHRCCGSTQHPGKRNRNLCSSFVWVPRPGQNEGKDLFGLSGNCSCCCTPVSSDGVGSLLCPEACPLAVCH